MDIEKPKIAVVAWVSFIGLALVAVYQVALEGIFLDYGMILAEFLIVAALPFAALRVAKRPLAEGYGLRAAPLRAYSAALLLALGCLPWGLVFGLPMERSLLAQGFAHSWELFNHPWVDPGRTAFALVLLAPLFGELFWRGFVLRSLEVQGSRRAAVSAGLAAGLGFLLFSLDPVDIAAMLPLSLGLSFLALSSGSVLPAILGHLAWNAASYCYNYFRLDLELARATEALGSLPLAPFLAAFALLALLIAFLIARKDFTARFARGRFPAGSPASGGEPSPGGAAGFRAVLGRRAPVALFVILALGISLPRLYEISFRPPPAPLAFGEAPWMKNYELQYSIHDAQGSPIGRMKARLISASPGRVELSIEAAWSGKSAEGSFAWDRERMELTEARLEMRGEGLSSFRGDPPGGGKTLLPFEWAFRSSALRMPEPSSDILPPYLDRAGLAGEGRMTHVMKIGAETGAGSFYCDRVDQYRGGEFFRSAYLDIGSPFLPVVFFDEGLEFRLDFVAPLTGGPLTGIHLRGK